MADLNISDAMGVCKIEDDEVTEAERDLLSDPLLQGEIGILKQKYVQEFGEAGTELVIEDDVSESSPSGSHPRSPLDYARLLSEGLSTSQGE